MNREFRKQFQQILYGPLSAKQEGLKIQRPDVAVLLCGSRSFQQTFESLIWQNTAAHPAVIRHTNANITLPVAFIWWCRIMSHYRCLRLSGQKKKNELQPSEVSTTGNNGKQPLDDPSEETSLWSNTAEHFGRCTTRTTKRGPQWHHFEEACFCCCFQSNRPPLTGFHSWRRHERRAVWACTDFLGKETKRNKTSMAWKTGGSIWVLEDERIFQIWWVWLTEPSEEANQFL